MTTPPSQALTAAQADALYVQAAKAQMAGVLEQAEAIYLRIQQAGFQRADLLSNLALIYKNTGRIDSSRKLFEQAISLFPDQAFLHHNYANLLHQLGDFDAVLQAEHRAIALGATGADPYLTLAKAHESLGDLQAASSANQEALRREADHPTALLNLGAIAAQQGQLDAAETYTRRALSGSPDLAKAHYNLGKVLFQQGRVQEACAAWQKAIQLNPADVEPWFDLALALLEIGQVQQLEQPLRSLLKRTSDADSRARLCITLSAVLRDQGCFTQALQCAREAVALAPQRADAFEALGSLLQASGSLDEAEQCLRQALQLEPTRYLAMGQLVQQLRGRCDASLAQQLIAVDEDSLVQPRDRIQVCFAKSQLFHAQKNYSESSAYLQRANREKLQLFPSDADELMARAERVAEAADLLTYSSDLAAGAGRLFIVGMPRSGTTLLESILSLNPQVRDLGEIPALREALAVWEADETGRPLHLFYDQACGEDVSRGNLLTTDKWLYNYMYAGQICRLMPAARILHCVRHPFDNLLSILRANFLRGNRYSSSVADAAKVLLQQHRLMNKASTTYPTQILTVDYDRLVLNPIVEIKNIIEWLGWPWNDAYLHPENNPRAVATASLIQVRSPITPKSLGGWRHYRHLLEPAEVILGSPEDCWSNLSKSGQQ